MKGYTFDPARLGISQAEADQHVADLLRGYPAGDPLEEARRRFGTDLAMHRVLEGLREQASRHCAAKTDAR